MYKNNGCPNCTEDKLCPECYLGMVKFEYEAAKRRIAIIQEEIGNYYEAITFWDLVCSESMNKIEYFREKLKEQHELPNNKTEQESERR